MFKKIALAGIFALASVVSFKPATVNAKPSATPVAPPMGSPMMKGICHGAGMIRC